MECTDPEATAQVGMCPNMPRWKSSNALITSALLFITNGPAQASGSRIGRPPTTIRSSLGDRLSCVRFAVAVR